jgi:hypothetical protein
VGRRALGVRVSARTHRWESGRHRRKHALRPTPHAPSSRNAEAPGTTQRVDRGLRTSATRSRGIHSLRSSSRRRRLADAPLGRASRELRLRSPSSLAGPQGSPTWVLRIRSGRGPTFRTARRGTTSAWIRHATGLISSGGEVPSRIDERLSPCLRRRSPRTFPRTRRKGVVEIVSPNPSPRDARTNIAARNTPASADISSGYVTGVCTTCGH